MRTLVVTGASGFIGRHVLARAGRGTAERLVALSRRGAPAGWSRPPDGPDITWLQGDLATRGPWCAVLDGAEAVLHLAAATGAATPRQLAAVNVDGTDLLLRECTARGVRRFVFVSSIAAAWPDDRHYPYAQTKRAAELLVSGSSLAWTIVRPTIVLGAGSPLWPKLRGLALLPLNVQIGGGTSRIQPILVSDLATALLRIAGDDHLAGVTLEIGGPDTVTMAAFLARVRTQLTGAGPGRAVPLPYGLLRGALVAANTILLGRSPVGPGQLTSFVTDGVATPHPFTGALVPGFSGLDAMIRESEAHG